MPNVLLLRDRVGRASLTLCLCLLVSVSHAIVKPPFDHRDYHHVILENGLEAVLVSDDKARQGAFALEVGVGSFADPNDLGGLAHLVEHAVLLGDSHDSNGKFRDFVSRNRGKQNGQTSYEFTRYQVSLDAQALPESLQRFGHLLKEPRFSAEALHNEVKIVDEEFSLVKKKTLWRYRETLTALTDQSHPFRKFAAGNTESLGQVSAEQLHSSAAQFIRDYYAPRNMRMVVVGNQSIDELEQAVRAGFGGLTNETSIQLPVAAPLLSSSRLPAQLEIRTTGEAPTLNLLFPLPDDDQLNAYKPVEYLNYVLDHQGPGSLQERLRNKSLIRQLNLAPGLNLGGQQTLSIAVVLTPKGLANTDEVIRELFAALATVQEKALDADLYESFRSLLAVQEFMPRKDSAQQLAMYLLKQRRDYSVADVRRGEFTAAPFNAERLNHFLSALEPDNALIILAHDKAKTSEYSKRFNIAFGAQEINEQRLASWRAVEPVVGLALVAGANSLPQDLHVQQDENHAQPTLRYETDRVQLWHAFNRMGNTPRTLFHLALTAPNFGDSADHRAMGEVWLESLQRRLKPIQEKAAKSGQSVELYSHSRGITLKGNAFRDQAQRIARHALVEIQQPLHPDEFALAKSAVLHRLANPKHKYAFEPLVDELKDMLLRSRWPSATLSQTLADRSYDQFESFRLQLWHDLKLTALSFGQVDDKELNAMNLLLNQTVAQQEDIAAAAIPESVPMPDALVTLDAVPGTGTLVKTSTAAAVVASPAVRANEGIERLADGERRLHQFPLASKDNALVFYHQGDAQDLHENAILQILTPLLRNTYFEEVRGRRQLAYGVLVIPVTMAETPGLSFIVQSNKADPALLTEVTDLFLDGFSQYLRTLDPIVLQRLQSSLLNDLALETTPAEELADYFWRKISDHDKRVAERSALADAIRAVKMEDLIAYVDTEMAGNQERSLILQGWNKTAWPPQNTLAGIPVAGIPVAGIPVVETSTAATSTKVLAVPVLEVVQPRETQPHAAQPNTTPQANRLNSGTEAPAESRSL